MAHPAVPRPTVRLVRPARRPEPVEDRLQLGRQRGRRADQVAVAGRRELEPPGVQEQPVETVRPAPRRAGAVDRVPGDRVPDRLEMDADLVGPPGDEVELEQGPGAEPLADPVARDRWPAVRDDRHPGPMLRIAADRRLDPPGVRGDTALDEGLVGLLHPAGLELGHQAGLGSIVLGDHQQAARVAVEAMDDPGPAHAGDPAVFGAAGPAEQGVDERPRRVSSRRMDDEPGRLVDDEQVVVLVDDAQRDRLAADVERHDRRAPSARAGRRVRPRRWP